MWETEIGDECLTSATASGKIQPRFWGAFLFSFLFSKQQGAGKKELFGWIAEEPGILSSLIKDRSFLGHTIPAAGKTQPQEKRLQSC